MSMIIIHSNVSSPASPREVAAADALKRLARNYSASLTDRIPPYVCRTKKKDERVYTYKTIFGYFNDNKKRWKCTKYGIVGRRTRDTSICFTPARVLIVVRRKKKKKEKST